MSQSCNLSYAAHTISDRETPMFDLLTRLHTFSDISIVVLVVGSVVAVAMVAPHIGSRLFRLPPDTARSDAALDAFKAVMAMMGVVLAFALVQANSNLKTVEGLVAKEAATISAVDRVLLRSGDPHLASLRPTLEAYATSIVDEEWPLLAGGERDQATDDLYNSLSRQARATSPVDARQQAMFAELLKQLDDMADFREQRIEEADAELATFFWTVPIGLMTLGYCLALLAAPTLGSTVSVGATAAAAALLLAFVLILDRPFEGETRVQPKEIVKAIQLNARRT